MKDFEDRLIDAERKYNAFFKLPLFMNRYTVAKENIGKLEIMVDDAVESKQEIEKSIFRALAPNLKGGDS